MGVDLLAAVLDRADADSGLSENAKILILAALDSDDDLADALRRPRTPLPEPDPGAAQTPAPVPVTPVRAFLSSITVEGFRGIGDRATLSLRPTPGLTVVSGRNGCGKSSFAEALEMALTRGSYRWRTRKGLGWKDSWRNLHQRQAAAILVRLAEEGRGTTTVAATWSPDAGLDDVTSWVQRPGAKQEPGLDGLGWSSDLELYRPFLSYDELGTLFAEPSKLHHALSSILGLERLDDAQRRLEEFQKPFEATKETAVKLAKELRATLPGLDDERAAAALNQLRKRAPDLSAVEALVTGADSDGPTAELARLQQLADLQVPAASALRAAVDRCREAADTLDRLTLATAEAATRRLDLLAHALQLHDSTGDSACPVCDQGQLDQAWADRVRTELAEDQAAARARATARRDLESCVHALTGMVGPLPAVLVEAVPVEAQADLDVSAVRAAWQAWSQLSTPEALSTDGPAALETLSAAVTAINAQARIAFARRQDAWRPLAVRLGKWLTAATAAQAEQATFEATRTAGAWLKSHAQEQRNERLRPLAERSREIWALLRQDSNVDLGAISLTGVKNQRRVELRADVDGENAGALSVMSQGELNALALALFLPKATSPDSPFGFVVIDDPVQAMDPAKVDGLATVLQEVARDRQVVVLTHDDRLAEAVRRLKVPASLLEVTRDKQSAVTVTTVSDPAERFLHDARAIASDRNMPDAVSRKIIPQLCRLALESRCRDLYFERLLQAGRHRDTVERDWAAATRTRVRIALVLDRDPAVPLDRWLDRDPHRRATLRVCGAEVHTGLTGNLHAAITDVQKTLADLTSAVRR